MYSYREERGKVARKKKIGEAIERKKARKNNSPKNSYILMEIVMTK